jgi:hypothetical protein
MDKRLESLEQQMAKMMGIKPQSNTVDSGFKGKVKELTVPTSMFNDFYVNMKNKLIMVPIILFVMFYYFKPPQIMVTKNKVKTIDYKLLFKYWVIITLISYIGLFYYFYKNK